MSRDLEQPVLAGAVAAVVGFASTFAVVLGGLRGVGATPSQAASGLFAVCAVMAVTSTVLSLRTRMPILLAWSTPGAALLVGAGPVAGGYPAAVGAFAVCGGLLVLTGLWGALGRALARIPVPIASAMLAGVLLPLCLAPVRAAVDIPASAGPVIVTWALLSVVARRWAVPGALAAAIIVVLAFEPLQSGPTGALPVLDGVVPALSVGALLGVALPLFVVTMASQNVPGMGVLAANGYRPSLRPVLTTTGGATVLGAPFGVFAVNLAAITAALVAGPDAHPDPARRWIASAASGITYLVLGLSAGLATALVTSAPDGLIEAVAGAGAPGRARLLAERGAGGAVTPRAGARHLRRERLGRRAPRPHLRVLGPRRRARAARSPAGRRGATAAGGRGHRRGRRARGSEEPGVSGREAAREGGEGSDAPEPCTRNGSAATDPPRRRRPPYAADALGIGLATGAYGVSFGVLAVAAGLSAAQACAMSLLVFTGGSQFAAIGVIGAGGAASTAVINGLLLGMRNTAYGLSMAAILRGSRGRRALASHLVIDESTAMARAQDDPAAARGAFLLTGLGVFVLWNLGTLAGALAGGGIGDPAAYGLDAMFPAAFLALLAPQLRQPGAAGAALVGGLIAVVLIPLTPAGIPVLAASLGVLVGLRHGTGRPEPVEPPVVAARLDASTDAGSSARPRPAAERSPGANVPPGAGESA